MTAVFLILVDIIFLNFNFFLKKNYYQRMIPASSTCQQADSRQSRHTSLEEKLKID